MVGLLGPRFSHYVCDHTLVGPATVLPDIVPKIELVLKGATNSVQPGIPPCSALCQCLVGGILVIAELMQAQVI